MKRANGANLRKGRFSELGRIYFITACTAGREPLFTTGDVAGLLCREFARVEDEASRITFAWVVMPDHVHWLLQLRCDALLSDVVRRFKGRSARRVNACLGRSGKLWQRGFHDHALRRDDDVRTTARYLINNPVRAGLVEHAGQYPYWDTIWHRRLVRG